MTRTSFSQPIVRRTRRGSVRSKITFRPRLEYLEDRAVPSTVTNLLDSGPGSLRDAIANTPGGGTVDFQPGLTGTIILSIGELAINNDLTITGPGASVITVSGNHRSRVFEITGAFNVAISGLTISGGYAPIANLAGGGVYIQGLGGGILNDFGTLTVRDCTIAGNNAGAGGGIANRGTSLTGGSLYGTMTITGCTITGNGTQGFVFLLGMHNSFLSGDGGGIYNDGLMTIVNCTTAFSSTNGGDGGGIANFGILTISSSTVAGNAAQSMAYSIYLGGLLPGYFGGNAGGIINGNNSGFSVQALTLYNTIVAQNTSNAARDSPDVAGPLTSIGHNLIGDGTGSWGFVSTDRVGVAPRLGPLQNNGGPTQTMALLPGSPAIGAGDPTNAPEWDQRGPGYPRVVNGRLDIGAFEVQSGSAAGTYDVVGRDAYTGQWWVSGSGTSVLADAWNPTVPWVDVQTGDFNGDGFTDIIGRDLTNGQWWVGLSDGHGHFSTSLWDAWNPNVTWVDIKVGDFTGNGKDDIVARVQESGQWWVGVSTGHSFATSLWDAWSTNVTWSDVQLGDFNGDSKADLAGCVQESGQWWVGVSTGHSFATSLWEAWNPNVTWVDVKVGDFNGDGRDDIAGRVQESGQWWVGLSTGHSFATTLWDAWNPNVMWLDVQVGDFNGDGRDDIIGRVQESGQWWVGLSTGHSFATSLWDAWNPNVMWVDVQVGDFNGDGKDDIAGKVLQSGQWWVGLSTGSALQTTLWDAWNHSAADWVDVHAGRMS